MDACCQPLSSLGVPINWFYENDGQLLYRITLADQH